MSKSTAVSRTSEQLRTRLIVFTGLFTAVIFVMTAYIHVPTGLGYTHLGDGFIFLAAAMLPKPYAIAAGALGASLADVASGMAIWAPATLILKALTVLSFTSKHGKVLVRRNFIALLPALILNIFGYSIYEALIMTDGRLTAALASAFLQTPFYAIQTSIGAAVLLLLGRVFDRLSLGRTFARG